MTDAFGHTLHIGDKVYFCDLDNPSGTYRSPCKMYRGIIIKLSNAYATIKCKHKHIFTDNDYYETRKQSNKIGLLLTNDEF